MTQTLAYRPWMTAALLAIVYAVGLVGLHSAAVDWFVSATPITLALTATGLLLHHMRWRLQAVLGLLAVALLGFLVEVAGVHTGRIFGHYAYGAVLGPRSWGVPLVIGLNWLVLVVAMGDVARRHLQRPWAAAVAAAVAMTLLDLAIEPVATALGYWEWEGGIIPLQNFIGWLGTSLGLQLIYQYLICPTPTRNPMAWPVLGLQATFFIVLNFTH